MAKHVYTYKKFDPTYCFSVLTSGVRLYKDSKAEQTLSECKQFIIVFMDIWGEIYGEKN